MINHSNYTATSSPSVNGHVTLSEPLHARHLIARGHSTQIHQYVILRHHQVQRANNVPKAKKSLNVHFPRINIQVPKKYHCLQRKLIPNHHQVLPEQIFHHILIMFYCIFWQVAGSKDDDGCRSVPIIPYKRRSIQFVINHVHPILSHKNSPPWERTWRYGSRTLMLTWYSWPPIWNRLHRRPLLSI